MEKCFIAEFIGLFVYAFAALFIADVLARMRSPKIVLALLLGFALSGALYLSFSLGGSGLFNPYTIILRGYTKEETWRRVLFYLAIQVCAILLAYFLFRAWLKYWGNAWLPPRPPMPTKLREKCVWW